MDDPITVAWDCAPRDIIADLRRLNELVLADTGLPPQPWPWGDGPAIVSAPTKAEIERRAAAAGMTPRAWAVEMVDRYFAKMFDEADV